MQALLQTGDYATAEEVSRAWIEALRRTESERSPEGVAAADLFVRALLLNGRGASPETLWLAQQTLEQKEAILGLAHNDLVPTLLNLGEALIEASNPDAAIAAMRRAVAIREVWPGADGVDLASSLDRLGVALIRVGRQDEALQVLERSLRTKETAADGGERGIEQTLEAMGWALQVAGQYSRARDPLERAAAIRAVRPGAHPAYTETVRLLVLQQWFEGHLPEARDAAVRALALAERTHRPDHPTIAQLLMDLAYTQGGLGNLAGARALLERAVAIAEGNYGPLHEKTGGAVNDLAGPTLLMGDYVAARNLYERALAIFETRFGPWHDSVATAVYNHALVDQRLGDYDSARRGLQRAQAIWERVFGRDHPFVAVALSALAEAMREQGDAAAAIPLLERALVVRERSLGSGHRDVADTLGSLAATFHGMGQARRAQDLTDRALAIWGRLNEPDSRELAVALALSADLHADLGERAEARQDYERALKIRERVFGPSHPLFAETQVAHAAALAHLGERRLALDGTVAAETTAREHLRLLLRYLPERQSLNYAATRPKGLDLILSLIGSSPDASAIAMDGVIMSRALVLDEMGARRGAGREPGEGLSSVHEELTSARQRLANLMVRGPGGLTPERYAALVQDTRREGERAERKLAEQSAAFRAELNRAQVGFEQVRESLPADSALVSFVRYERTAFDWPVRKTTSGAPRQAPRAVPSYLAFVLRSGQPPTALPLGSALTIDRVVARWRADIAAAALMQAGTSSDSSQSAARASGVALRKLIWDPLTPHVSNASRIFVVPDDALSLVPFVALPVGERSYVLERAPIVHYLSAERDLVASSQKTASAGRGLLALGGPAFDDRTLFAATRAPVALTAEAPRNPAGPLRGSAAPCADFQTVRFQPLTGTKQEVRELSDVWSLPSSPSPEPARVLLDRDASESAFKKNAPRSRVLHLATHGFFLSDACAPNAPAGTRAIGGLTTSSTRQETAATDNPLLLSGLALAGANQRATAAPDEDDGILTAEEVASLDLSGVEWAVLSACDTGLGEIKAGEGVFGLRRAFQIAGARTVIMSLWSVDDQSTRAWMRALYEGRLRDRLDTADAVRAASLSVLRDRRGRGLSTHPFYWAAFVAAGDWR